jgi:DNA polymerase I-like protein with 3'-5' exonuclease and polymerase domains
MVKFRTVRPGKARSFDTRTSNLYDQVALSNETVKNWVLPELPSLSGVNTIQLDWETDGVKWWAGDKPVGFGLGLNGEDFRYIPFGHEGGGNIPFENVKRWLEREVRGKHIDNHTTKFEVHNGRNLGINLERQGNTFGDVAHDAALLDDHRRKFSLEVLVDEFLEEETKVLTFNGQKLDMSRVKEYHAAVMAPRAIGDVRQVAKLKKIFQEEISAQDLGRTQALEDSLIPVTAEMEWNGALLDVEQLERWSKEVEQEHLRCLYKLNKATGLNVNPDSGVSMTALFQKLGVPLEHKTEGGDWSFTDVILKHIEHPMVQLARRAGKLADLQSKYLTKYRKALGPDGILRYALHQLRGDEGGTISGRYSSSGLSVGGQKIGANIQQVIATEKNAEQYGAEYIIRRLFIAAGGAHFLTADAEQIEYRLFAHHAQTPGILSAYAQNPRLHFHKLIWSLLEPYAPNLTYKALKNLNFAKIYGAGLAKLALMLEFITERQYEMLMSIKASARKKHVLLKQMVEIDRVYNEQLPEVGPLMNMASHLAMSNCTRWCDKDDELHQKYEHRGFVMTALGRRSRFHDGQRIHKALNGVIQGTAADVMKMKLVQLYKMREELGLTMRFTVHDEFCGDLADKKMAKRVAQVLDEQLMNFRVPILWGPKIGANWADAEAIAA